MDAAKPDLTVKFDPHPAIERKAKAKSLKERQELEARLAEEQAEKERARGALAGAEAELADLRRQVAEAKAAAAEVPILKRTGTRHRLGRSSSTSCWLRLEP